MFEQAVRGKLRWFFRGNLSVEDLWDLNVESLDAIFKQLNKRAREAEEEESLLSENTENKVLRLKIEIVRYIVETKLSEKAAMQNLAAKKARKEKLLKILQDKQDASLSEMSEAELQKAIAELE